MSIAHYVVVFYGINARNVNMLSKYPEIGNLEVLHKIKQIGTTGSTTGTTTNIYDFLIMTS